MPTKRISIDFQANGEGMLKLHGGTEYQCLGKPGFSYTEDLTVQGVVGRDKFETKYSNEFQVEMKWVILIIGQHGIYIHEGANNLRDNNGPSAGCIHLAPGDAKAVYDWVDGRTRITIDHPW